jgi:hypothetical protein
MEQIHLDTATIRAAEPGTLDAVATVGALCDALDAARAELRQAAQALEMREGDARRAATRLEIAQRARAAAEVERGRFQLALNAVRVECHRVLADKDAGPERREVVRAVLAALDGRR